VIGNLSVGGTGKTPVTVWLARTLAARGLAVGIVCSGYRGSGRDVARLVAPDSDPAVVGDEAVLAARESGCPVAAGRDRVAAAELLVTEHHVEIVLADDGLQHLRLARDFEIAVVDGERGLGSGLCIPFGPLREPVARLATVDAVIVNGGAWSSDGSLRCSLRPVETVEPGSGRRRPIAELRGQRVHAVAAIGNPGRFFASLEAVGIPVTGHAHLDHAALAPADLVFADQAPVLVTTKDAVKFAGAPPAHVVVVVAELVFDDVGQADRLVESIAMGARQKRAE
jgi:tetraacyldisaccharide 4'-kinase